MQLAILSPPRPHLPFGQRSFDDQRQAMEIPVYEITSRLITKETLMTEYFLVFTPPAICKMESQVWTTASGMDNGFRYGQRLQVWTTAPSIDNSFKIDDKRNIDDRMLALLLPPPASCTREIQVCDLRTLSLAVDN